MTRFSVHAVEWQDKVKRYTKYEAVQLKSNPKKAASREVAMAAESEKLLALVSARDYVVVLDERGTRVTSHDVAHLLAKAGTLAWAANLPAWL